MNDKHDTGDGIAIRTAAHPIPSLRRRIRFRLLDWLWWRQFPEASLVRGEINLDLDRLRSGDGLRVFARGRKLPLTPPLGYNRPHGDIGEHG
jgi:hypothetical protein